MGDNPADLKRLADAQAAKSARTGVLRVLAFTSLENTRCGHAARCRAVRSGGPGASCACLVCRIPARLRQRRVVASGAELLAGRQRVCDMARGIEARGIEARGIEARGIEARGIEHDISAASMRRTACLSIVGAACQSTHDRPESKAQALETLPHLPSVRHRVLLREVMLGLCVGWFQVLSSHDGNALASSTPFRGRGTACWLRAESAHWGGMSVPP